MSRSDSIAVVDEHGWYFNLDVGGLASGVSEAGYRVLESDIEMMWQALQQHRIDQLRINTDEALAAFDAFVRVI